MSPSVDPRPALPEHDAPPTGVMKNVIVGLGIVSGGTPIAWTLIELLRSDPHEGFRLLTAWGPWAIVIFLALYIIWDLSRRVLRMFERALERGTAALEKLAVAQEKSAERDDRQLQEMQTLTTFTAQSTERMNLSMQALHEKLDILAQERKAP